MERTEAEAEAEAQARGAGQVQTKTNEPTRLTKLRRRGARVWDYLRDPARVFEVILLLIVLVGISLTLRVSFDLRSEAALFPRVVSTIGAVAWVVYVIDRYVFMPRREQIEYQVLDIGILAEGIPARVILRRTLEFFLFIIGGILAIILAGFHVGIPLFAFCYLVIAGRVKVWWALVAAAAYEALLHFVYSNLLHTPWYTPILTEVFNIPLRP